MDRVREAQLDGAAQSKKQAIALVKKLLEESPDAGQAE